MNKKSASPLALACFASILAVSPANAAGGGGSNDSTKPTCKKGYVYSETQKKCVKQSAGIITDKALKEQGWALAYRGDYGLAIDLFNLVQNRQDAEALNGLGYSHRKQGQYEAGISYYEKALKVDPGYVLAREYLGEGYVSLGKLDLARQQLSEIKRLCGTACEEYKRLATVISVGGTNDW